ncbi:hypothetical protein GJ744_009596 [Endocarpon pusillum]|uniref:Uncharacterized protein n=1 Tax=Endocarpon pusillum TaxID=364733 RepID=A0A8H7AFI9_9EURO|nr:hypothetical protein GJ744_009596 [Endocarpon pusillum]
MKRPRRNHFLDPKSAGLVNLATGGLHAAALTYDHKILTWEVNDLSALGRDTPWEATFREFNGEGDSGSGEIEPDLNPLESSPAAIPADKFPAATRFVQVAAGDSTTSVLTEAGLVHGWGTFRDSRGVFGFQYLKPNDEFIKVQPEPRLIQASRESFSSVLAMTFALRLTQRETCFPR